MHHLRIGIFFFLFTATGAFAEEDTRVVPALPDRVQAILSRHCQACHSADEPEAALDLTSREKVLFGSASGRIVVAGNADGSLLLKLVAPESKPHMPPEGQLSDEEQRTLADWVNGLKADDLPARALAGSINHWAYQPLKKAEPPSVRNETWVRTAVDRFILSKLEAAGVTPAPEADAATLCRRLYFDLVGLPPAPDDVDDFVRSRANPATAEVSYLALVDKLLASPNYGERWGRHWLDLARYADSSGYHEDLDRPHAWRYRDYVIQSFNGDKPYAQFVVEQLAGDEFAPEDPVAWIATGFCRNGPSNDSNMGQGIALEKYRLDLLDDVIATTSAVFLGQTIGCARCHDHKHDPISQADYYRLLAVFDSTRRVSMATDGRGVPVEVDPKGKKEGQESAPMAPSIMALTNIAGASRTTHLLWRGDVANPGPVVTPGVPDFLKVPAKLTLVEFPSDRVIGRRLALAEWIVSARNALTWRVAANRLWQHHFGTGIVATPSNFGQTGAAPTHPELLDWLAMFLLENEGRWKSVHRLLVTSSVYRQSTRSVIPSADFDNRLLSRRNPRRLEAEVLRDAVLSVSGSLNPSMGGPGVKPRIRPELLVASQRNKWPVVKVEGPEHWRRSVYIYVKRQLPFPMLELFDAPNTAQTCERREESVVPTQALVLMNDEFTEEQAGLFSDRILAAAGDDLTAQVIVAFRHAYGRAPTTAEREEGIAFLQQQADEYLSTATNKLSPDELPVDTASAQRQALVDLCQVLFNSNEFAYVD